MPNNGKRKVIVHHPSQTAVVAPKRSLSQNFIKDTELLGKLVLLSGVQKQDNVLEIGPGKGALTRALAARAGCVVALETDGRLIPYLLEALSDCTNVTILQGDAMTADLNRAAGLLTGMFSVVANLPYHITTPLLTRLLTGGFPLQRIAVMVQKEAAERICAEPGTKAYGSLSVLFRYFGETKVALSVPRDKFSPVPRVDSVFLTAVRRHPPVYEADDGPLFIKTCNAAFFMRRKTIQNNLMAFFGLSKDSALQALTAANLQPTARGENFTLEEFMRLSAAIRLVL